jgi:hypothetical protein
MYKIPDREIEKRLSDWRKLRKQLEDSIDPFEEVVEFFNKYPHVKFYTDPYDSSTWPTAWELIEEHKLCRFNKILAICYTIQLCDRFKNCKPRITISIDKPTGSIYYMLFIDDLVYGFEDEVWIESKYLPKSLKNIKIYNMPPLY